MNAVEFIQENVDPLVVLDYYNFRCVKEYQYEIRACCEIHKGDNPNAFVWNKKNNLWYCYTGECGGGDVIELVKKIESITFAKAMQKAADILGLNIEGMEFNISENRLKNEQKQWLRKQSERFNNQQTVYELPKTEYTDELQTFTRFDKSFINYYKAAFCSEFPTERTVLKNKLCIPIYEEGVIKGVALRDTTGNFMPKWMYQPPGMKASNMLYNIDNVSGLIDEGTEEVILVEGIFDVWAYHRININNVLAIFGSNISDNQYKTLIKLNVKLIFSFDNDTAGTKCTTKAVKMFEGKTELYSVLLPESKDPGDCTQEELMSAYLNRKRI